MDELAPAETGVAHADESLPSEAPAGSIPGGALPDQSMQSDAQHGRMPEVGHAEEQMPRVQVTRRSAIAFGLFVLSAVAFLYFVLPKLAGLSSTAHRIERGDTWWIMIGVLLEICSFGGYVVLFRAVFVRGPSPIGWRESYQITMAGLAATRLFAAAGAGGIALTAWALRRSGMEARIVACRMIAFMALLYGVYMASLVIVGLGLYTGLFPGPAPFAITVVHAIF